MSEARLMNKRKYGSPGAFMRLAGLCLALVASPWNSFAQESATAVLEGVKVSSLSGNKVQVDLVLTAPPSSAPSSFTIDNPARIALDLAGVSSNLDKKGQVVDTGMLHSVTAVQSKDRTRVVFNMVKLVAYETRVDGNHIYVTLLDSDAGQAASTGGMSVAGAAGSRGATTGATGSYRVEKMDFRRGQQGEGRILVTLSSPAVPLDIREEGGKIIVEFANTELPPELAQRLDVMDFATPVNLVDTSVSGKKARIAITASGNYEHLAYQADRLFTIEVKPVTKTAKQIKKDEPAYKGDKLSLNFQNIEVRAALQVIADFTSLNMVVSDSVTGGISLRLKDVPWDQALDLILRSKGLGMRKTSNVVLIAPSEELAAREKQELEAQKQIVELEPLRSEIIQINYAKASDFATLLKAKENSLMSARGSVTVDERTNTLLVQDTASRLAEMRKVISDLDIPVRQVLIESRIVIANDDFSKEIGVRVGATAVQDNGSDGIIGLTGSASGNDTMVNSALSNIQSSGTPYPVSMPSLNDRLGVNLPVLSSNAGRLGLAILGQDYLLDLELSALQAEGRGEVVSSPRVITANQKEAFIEQGVEIPYQQATSSGATSVSFKKAVLSLKVTPQITPDDRVIMDLQVNKDSVGEVFLGVPSINTREINTQVLVENGETVVLGGIYEQTRSDEVDKVPLLGDLPVVGTLFRQNRKVDDKVELLIFVTPKILKEGLGMR